MITLSKDVLNVRKLIKNVLNVISMGIGRSMSMTNVNVSKDITNSIIVNVFPVLYKDVRNAPALTFV